MGTSAAPASKYKFHLDRTFFLFLFFFIIIITVLYCSSAAAAAAAAVEVALLRSHKNDEGAYARFRNFCSAKKEKRFFFFNLLPAATGGIVRRSRDFAMNGRSGGRS